MEQSSSVSLLIVAAEASSGFFAQRLIEHWIKEKRDFNLFGVGTKEMENLGFTRLGKSEEMAVVGAVEIIEHWSHLKSVFNSILEQAKKTRPQLAILLDYPEFNMMLAKELKKLGIPVIYYVSPQVWAWRQGRIKKIKKHCRKVLLLFPFEIEFYKKHQVEHDFVGHPLLDEVKDEFSDSNLRNSRRERFGVAPSDFLLGIMPGSRRGEITQHLKVQLQAAEILKGKVNNLKVAVLVAPTLEVDYIKNFLEEVRYPIQVIKAEPFEMISLCDFICVASGTATLSVALMEVPMIIIYKMKWFTGIIARVLVRGVKFFGLPNLIADRSIVPELFQGEVNPENVAKRIYEFISDGSKFSKIKNDLSQIKTRLGNRGATKRVADIIDSELNRLGVYENKSKERTSVENSGA